MKRWHAFAACIALSLAASGARAHKSSDSYLQIASNAQGTSVRWDIALRDLDAAIDLDANEDGKLTWGEIKAAWPQIQSYATARMSIRGCTFRLDRRALERRNDGAYAVMFLASDCKLSGAPVIAYSLFREIDPTHRGIAKVQLEGQPLTIGMLDPMAPEEPAAGKQAQGSGAIDGASPGALASSGVGGFLREGVRHILTGYDHVLFLLCLLLPSVIRRTPGGWRSVDRLSEAVWPVVGIVSAFTVAHSITLALAATKVVSLSPALIEPAIALTIVLAALDNVWPVFPLPRAAVAFCFGLIHGFGFAGVLSELNLPTGQFALALLQFNVGLEMGQLAIVVGVTALLFLLRERPGYRAWVVQGGSAAAMLIGVLWLIERSANVSLIPI